MRLVTLQRLVLFVFFTFSCSVVFADQEQRRIEEEKRLSVDQAAPALVHEYQRFLMEYGGWLNYRYVDLKNTDNDDSVTDSFESVFSIDSRFWTKLTIKPPAKVGDNRRHFIYMRLKNLYIERYGDSSVERYDNDGPHLDYAFTMLDFTPYRIEAGRRYFATGRGIAYGNVNDGVKFNYYKPGWNIGGFVAHTLPHEENIDSSVPGFDKKSDRTFYGVGAGYAGIKNHVIYTYALVQRDDSKERPDDPDQQYLYHSEYFSVGAHGTIKKKYAYWMEAIKEFGKSRVFGTNEQTDVDAWGANFGVERSWKSLMLPKVTLEYAFGSGDKERVSVTDTDGGNLTGDDNNFLYFGYMPTGIALSPRLSNLHMYRLGFEFRPLRKMKRFRDFLVGFDYFYFQKHKEEGGISDFEATAVERDIGHEVDAYFDWQVLSDLNLSLEYGYFMPGKAYPDETDDQESYFSVSFTHTF